MAGRLFRNVISSTEVASLPVLNFGGRIKLIDLSNGSSICRDELHNLLGLNAVGACDGFVAPKVIGFDIEAKPSAFSSLSRNRTALIQLASESACVLFRTVGCRDLPVELIDLISDSEVVKVGQGVGGDVLNLREDFSIIDTRGFVDLHAISCKLNFQPKSLQSVVGLILRKRLLKDMRISNWEDWPLRCEQIQYAAIDAWAARAVYIEILEKFRHLDIASVGHVIVPQVVLNQTSQVSPTTVPSSAATINSSMGPFSSPQVELVDYCLRNNLSLRLGGFEKLGGRFKCIFQIGTQKYTSLHSHTSIKDSQIDAAMVALTALRQSAQTITPIPFSRV